MAIKSIFKAVNEALIEEMTRDSRVIVFGEDVELGISGDTKNLATTGGPQRVRNTPICESTITGMAVGAAAAGYKVVVHLMFANFIYTGFDAIANQMAKMNVMTGGQLKLPITVLAISGGGGSRGAQHSDSPHPLLMNLGGVNVLVPATPADAKGLLKTAIRGDTPTFLFETIGGGSGEVPEDDYTVPLGCADVIQEGTDVTIITIGSTRRAAVQAAEVLQTDAISAEVIDIRSLVPLDRQAVVRSLTKTGRIVIVDEARERCSAASEIAAMVAEVAFGALKAPIRRVAVPNVALPYAPNAESLLLPTAERIVRAAHEITSAHPRA